MCVIVVKEGKDSKIWKRNLHWDVGMESEELQLTQYKFKSDS